MAVQPDCAGARRETLIREHVGLVKYEVDRVASGLPDYVDRDDLLSAGLLGLIRAVDRYDPSRGAGFTTYATLLIRGAILDELRSLDWAPRGLRGRYRRLEETVAALRQHLGRQPTEEEIMAELGIAPEEYQALLRDASTTAIVSLESLAEAAGDTYMPTTEALGDVATDYSPTAVVDRAEMRRLMTEAIEELSEREKLVLSLYYREEMTMLEIGMILGVTESRVCQIHTQTIARLRAGLQARLNA